MATNVVDQALRRNGDDVLKILTVQGPTILQLAGIMTAQFGISLNHIEVVVSVLITWDVEGPFIYTSGRTDRSFI